MKIKVSSSVKQFETKATIAWGLKLWKGIDDSEQDLLFFGLFHDRDFEVFHNFKGKKSVFWCGGDILRLVEDYERRRVLKLDRNVKHYCETEEQGDKLREMGFNPTVIPSFLGNINNYSISFKKTDKWKIWICGHPKREIEYGFDTVIELAKVFPDIEFHLYGVDEDKSEISYEAKNIISHGLVSEEELDEDIKDYHCGLRTNRTDGVSEVIIKSILLGQYPISFLPYEGVWQYKEFGDLIMLIEKLKRQVEPNYETRSIWIKQLNQYPWCEKKFWSPDKIKSSYDK